MIRIRQVAAVLAISAVLAVACTDPDNPPPTTETTATTAEPTTGTSEPTTGTTDTTVDPTTSSSSTTSTTEPPAAEWPGPGNTGPTGDLTPYTAAQVEAELAADGLVENAQITGGNIDPPSESTLSNFVLDGAGAQYGIRTIDGQHGVLIEDGVIHNVTSTGGYGGGVTYDQIEVHDSGGDGFKPRSSTTIRRSWTHLLGKDPGCVAPDCVHGDGWQFDGPKGSTITGVTIEGNHCEAPWSFLEGQSTYHQQSCVQVNSGVNVTDTVVEANYLEGAGSYSVNCSPPGSGTILFRDNVFSTDVHYGPNTGCSRWEGNTYEDGTPA